ncbi:MAG: YwiC-like family protein [Anaeromyxobacteraceae bacterium]|nr:YwiC-like family protein [Anaeromyxobacteraceae bacterium]
MTSTGTPRPRSLLPQEHGAWGQLAMPLLSAFAVGGVTAPAALLCAATVLAFLAHEPWLVVLGHRGVRALRDDGARARRVMWSFLGAAAATGLAGVWLVPGPARWALLVPAALAAAVVGFVLARMERTIPGELTVVSALASSGFAVAVAGGAPLAVAAAATATWVLAFAASVFAVHVVLVRALSKGEEEHRWRNAGLALLVGGGGSAVAVAAGLGWAVPAAVAPTLLLSLVVCLAPFSARQLRELGWGLVGSTTASLVILVWMLR